MSQEKPKFPLHKALVAGAAILGASAQVPSALSADKPAVMESEPYMLASKVLGIQAEKLRSNFRVDVQIDAGLKGPYIVHVGQDHQNPFGDAFTIESTQEILRSQQGIESFLLALVAEKKLPCVYAEAKSKEVVDMLKSVKELSAKLAATIKENLVSERTVHPENLSIVEALVPVYNSFRAYHGSGQVLKIIEEMLQSIEKTGPDEPTQNRVQKLKGAIQELKQKFKGEPNALMNGAAAKLYMENKIPLVCPTEDAELNNKAIALSAERFTEAMKELPAEKEFSIRVNKQIALYDKLNTLDIDPDKIEEMEKIADEISENTTRLAELKDAVLQERQERDVRVQEMKRKADEVMFTERERKFLSFVFENEAAHDSPPLAVVVFGAGHDFTSVVTESNAVLDRRKYGLIKVVPK